MMIAAKQNAMIRSCSSNTIRPRLPTLGHAGRFSRCSVSSCFAWLLLVVGVLVVSGESSAMPSTALVGQETASLDVGALLDAGEGAVVTLVAGMTRLVAHRAVLAATSPVFATMLSHDSLEANSSVVAIRDMEGPVLRQLVEFLYTGRATQLPNMGPQLLAVAEEYGVSGLRAACEQQLAEHLSVDNAAATAVLAVRYNCSSLRQAVVAFIRTHVFQVMTTQGWKNAVVSHPGAIVELTCELGETTTQTSAPAAAGIDTATTTRPHSDDGRTPMAATPSSTCPDTPPLDDAYVSHLRSLSGKEKSRRLWQAAEEEAVGEVRALLAAGADVGAGDADKWTALHYAAYEGHVEAARRLLQAGAAVDARTSLEQTPLYYAAAKGQAAVARLLLAASADPIARDEWGWTPLHYAAWNGHAEVATALLEAGADKGARTNTGKTPLDYARQNYQYQLIDILQTH